jgi:cyclic pyranopterin phosphate synthase
MARLLFFAAAREAAGTREALIEAATIGEALKLAVERFGSRFEHVLALCTILHREQTVARDRAWEIEIEPNDEIALLPPVSGGADGSGANDHGQNDGMGNVRMVDVGDKEETVREAVAICRLITTTETRDRLLRGAVDKGDAVGAAKVAGTLAAKRVPELIPLCHPVRTTFVEISVDPSDETTIEIRATVRGRDRTGFEMEALTACAIASLTLYDMAKAEDPRMRIEGLRIVAKSGGKSGSLTYE